MLIKTSGGRFEMEVFDLSFDCFFLRAPIIGELYHDTDCDEGADDAEPDVPEGIKKCRVHPGSAPL